MHLPAPRLHAPTRSPRSTPLPRRAQTAEYLLEHGLLDLVVPRSFLKGALFEMIGFYKASPGALPARWHAPLWVGARQCWSALVLAKQSRVLPVRKHVRPLTLMGVGHNFKHAPHACQCGEHVLAHDLMVPSPNKPCSFLFLPLVWDWGCLRCEVRSCVCAWLEAPVL